MLKNAGLLTLAMAAMAVAVEPRFEPQNLDDVTIGYGLATGDVDGDGKPDVLLADKDQIRWYQNPGRRGEAWARHVMAENLTERDNVCITARDIDGDGRVEVAVGAQWNPGETSDREHSGALFYLNRPKDPTQQWSAVRVPGHDPTVHRMHWVRVGEERFALAVLPLHGIGNQRGEGATVRLQFATPPADPVGGEWVSTYIDTSLHMTHNFELLEPEGAERESLAVAGREGVRVVVPSVTEGELTADTTDLVTTDPAGEVREENINDERRIAAVISPIHGNKVVAYTSERGGEEGNGDAVMPQVLDDTLRQGHALEIVDVLGLGRPQIIAGWRMPNADKLVGVKLYVPDDALERWTPYWVDRGAMACEDLKVVDLNDDDRPDIIASGRATKNLVIYWNRTGD